MNGLLALAALAYVLPLHFLGIPAAASIEKFALYAAGAGALVHLLRRHAPLARHPRPFFTKLIVGAALWTGIWFSLWCYDGLVLGAYDYSGISSVLASWSQNAGLLTSPYYRSANGSEFYPAHHFSPVLILFVPLYFFVESHAFYGVLLQLIFAAGLLVWYRLARSMSALPLLMFSAMLFVPSLYRMGVSFHMEILVFVFAGLLFIGVRRKDTGLAGIALFALLLTKEDQGIYTALFGISLLFDRDRRKIGAVIAGTSAAAFILISQVYLPHASGEPHSRFISYWGSASLGELILKTGPLDVVRAWEAGWRMPWAVLLSVGLFPLLRPALAVCVLFPIFTIHLMSLHPLFHEADAYYMYTYLPYLLYGALEGIEKAAALAGKFFSPVRAAAFFGCLFFAFAAYQARARKDIPAVVMPDRSPGIRLRAFLEILEPGRTVHTHAFLSAQVPLANRVYSLAHPAPPDYILLETGREASQDETPSDVEKMENLARTGRLLAESGGLRLYTLAPARKN